MLAIDQFGDGRCSVDDGRSPVDDGCSSLGDGRSSTLVTAVAQSSDAVAQWRRPTFNKVLFLKATLA